MEIEVRIDNEVVFSGLAEDFLYQNDLDIELEDLLDRLDSMLDGSIVFFEDMEIEKLETNLFS